MKIKKTINTKITKTEAVLLGIGSFILFYVMAGENNVFALVGMVASVLTAHFYVTSKRGKEEAQQKPDNSVSNIRYVVSCFLFFTACFGLFENNYNMEKVDIFLLIAFVGAVIFPPTQKLVPITFKRGLALSILASFLLLGHAVYMDDKKLHDSFQANPDAVIARLEAAAQRGDYTTVLSDAGRLKGAGNAEINRLYKEAVAGKEKQDKEREMNRQASNTEKMNAYYQCKYFIKERLNDPRSLNFPDSNTAHITNKGDTYDIAGTFRAKNALGSSIQASYACTVTENRDRGTWTLNYLSEF